MQQTPWLERNATAQMISTKPSEQVNNMYRHEQQYILDQKELNELLNFNVNQLAQARNLSPTSSRQRRNSDEDVYVEETLVFAYNPSQANNQSESSSPSKKLSNSTQQPQIQSVEELSQFLLIEVHKYDESLELDNDQRILKLMMGSSYADAEIDKLLETFGGQLKLNLNNINGDQFIENDIRFSESIREAIDEVKLMQRAASNKQGELDKRKFLLKYMEVAESLGVSLTVEHLLPALNEIFKQDADGNQQKGYIKLVFQSMDKLIDFLSASEITVGYNGIRDYIMPFFYDFFQSEKIDENVKQEMQNEVIELLVKVTKIMTNEDRADKVLPIILETIRDDSDEEKRILGLELVDKLAEFLGKDNCQNFLMYEIVSLQDDPIYRVRKETVTRIVNISKVLGKEIFLRILFPVFKKLSGDPIWGVRRSAVEVLPHISNLCPIEIKNGVLIEMFKKFSQDSSKWVKMATFQYLGPFIASYEGIEPNPLLIEYYISMCEQNKSTQADNEVPYHCAFNFPAVLLTLGVKSWDKLQPVHDFLVKDPRSKVRRTLAFSLHEIASILGPDLTEKQLIPVLYHFLKDVDEVKEGVIINLPKFIKVLSPEQRENYVDKFAQTQLDAQDWRKRTMQAKQIKQFSKIFTPETVNKFYVPVFFQLCQDQVAEVRIESAKGVKNIALKLSEKPELFQEFVTKVLLFKSSNKYNLRQTFIYMAESLMLCRDLFLTHFLKDFCDLQRDRIVNVRMVLCEVLLSHYKSQTNGGLVQEIKDLRLMVKTLKVDQVDVSSLLEEVAIAYVEGDGNELQVEEIKVEGAVSENQKEEEDPQNKDHQIKDKEDEKDKEIVDSITQNGVEEIKQQDEEETKGDEEQTLVDADSNLPDRKETHNISSHNNSDIIYSSSTASSDPLSSESIAKEVLESLIAQVLQRLTD